VTEPERWIVSRPRTEGRLIEAALAETPSDAALGRAASRLSRVGVVIGTAGLTVAHASHASAVVEGALAKTGLVGAVAGTTPAAAGLVTTAMIVKSVAVGFAVGCTLFVGGHYVSVAQSPSRQVASTSLTSSVPRRTPSKAPPVARPRIHEVPQAIASSSFSSAPSATRDTTEGTPTPARSLVQEEPAAPDVSRAQPIGISSTAQFETVPAVGVPPRAKPQQQQILAREVAGLARARHALKQGDAATALRELSALDSHGGYRVLGQEAALLRVEALAQSGQRRAAASLARQLLNSGAAEAHRATLLRYATIENQ
jgi:hypothetical protein